MWMMIGVPGPNDQSRAEIARYRRMRCGIDAEFRVLKQTAHRDTLRCRNDARLLAEPEGRRW